MPVISNPKHERFAQEIAKGIPASVAYITAGRRDDLGRGCRTYLHFGLALQRRIGKGLRRNATESFRQLVPTAPGVPEDFAVERRDFNVEKRATDTHC